MCVKCDSFNLGGTATAELNRIFFFLFFFIALREENFHIVANNCLQTETKQKLYLYSPAFKVILV